jgi:lactoylglutathione lyase
MAMKKVNYTIVFVADMKRSIEFYRDVLGFPLKIESPGWSEFATEGTVLALHPGAGGTVSEAVGEKTPAGTCQPGFLVPDLEAFHQQVVAKGAKCVQPPKMQDFGAKLGIYADPDGLMFSVGEERELGASS